MGGWFTREITSPEAFKGIRYRMAGPGAEVLRRLGAIVVTLPGGEIMPALKSGAIDASEWIGPWLDMALGLHQAVGYYYYPGFHEPGTGVAVGINKGVWESFHASDRRVVEAVAAGEYARSLAEFNANNALSLRKLRDEGAVKILKFDDFVLKAFLAISKDVVAEIGAGDDLSRKIYASYQQFLASIMDWSDIAERAFLNAAGLLDGSNATMRRRDILAGAGSLAAGATLSFPAPAIAQGIRQLKMVTDWPEDSAGLHSSAVRFAQTIGAATGGRIKIEVFPAGALVRPFETFDAVGAGVADMYHSADYYWEKKSPAFNFFAAIPFGFTADELFAWIQYGGGQELWDALSGQFNIKSLLCSSTGSQMGGWFTREITSPEAFRGLRYRMPGLGARGAPAAGRHRGEPAGRRDRAGAQVRRHRRQRMGGALARHGARSAQGRGLLLLSRVPRAGHRHNASASTSACGKASMRATGRSSRTLPPANTRAPWRSSMPTTHCRCASCATKAPSRS